MTILFVLTYYYFYSNFLVISVASIDYDADNNNYSISSLYSAVLGTNYTYGDFLINYAKCIKNY